MKNKAIKAMGLTTAILTTVGTTTVLAEEVETVEVVTEKATTNETVIETAREKVAEKQEEVDVQTIVANQTTKETERIGKEKDAKATEVANVKTELVGKETTVTEKEEKVAELEALKDNATIEKPKVEKGIADTNQEIGTKENDVNGKVTEVDGIKQQVTAQEAVVASETSKLDAITTEKEKLVNANTELSNALKQQDVANKEVATQTSNVASAEQTKSELEQEKTSILEANADKQADIERLESEISELSTQVEEKQPQVDTTKTDLEAVIRQLAEMNIPTMQFTERFMELQTTLANDKSLEAERIAEGRKSMELEANRKIVVGAIKEAFDNTTLYDPLNLPLEIRYKLAFLAQNLVKGYQEKVLEYLYTRTDRYIVSYEDVIGFSTISPTANEGWKFSDEMMKIAQYLAEYSTSHKDYDVNVDGHFREAWDYADNRLVEEKHGKDSKASYLANENLALNAYSEAKFRKGFTERELALLVYSDMRGMLMDDSKSNWGHGSVAVAPLFSEKFMGLSFSKNVSKSTGKTWLMTHYINSWTATEKEQKRRGISHTEVKKPTTEALEVEKTNLQSTYDTLNSELTEIKNSLETKTTEFNTLTEGIVGLEDVNARIERNETTLANFRQALATAQSNKAVADDLVAKATEKSTKYTELVTQETNQRAVVEREVATLNDLKGQLVTKEQELSTLRNELSELETKVLTLTERLNTLNNIDDLLSDAKSELALAVSERDALKQNIATLELELADLVTSYNDAKVLSDAEQAKLTELREELTFLKEELGLIEMALAPVFEEEKPAFVGVIEEDGKKWEVKADGTIVEIKEEENKKPIETVGGAVKPITKSNEKTLPQTGDVQSGLSLLGTVMLSLGTALGFKRRK